MQLFTFYFLESRILANTSMVKKITKSSTFGSTDHYCHVYQVVQNFRDHSSFVLKTIPGECLLLLCVFLCDAYLA